ncbi:MAG: peptide chain release factor N(5)-glutamine methyltransferase [Gemmatimonadota bacterium]|nr:peptide chain release factor N(5)-glutamine methyltransferase [Gemmatimonadota bacterium]
MDDGAGVSVRMRSRARSPTVASLMLEVSSTLEAHGVPDFGLEARDLVATLLDQPRLWPWAHREDAVTAAVCAVVRKAAWKRATGAPFAYAVGRAAFRHLTLEVDERVLIPRQETEQLVEAVLEWGGRQGGVAIDVGTGSGAIAISLAHEGAFRRVVATDVSRSALEVARANAERLASPSAAPLELRHGSLLAPVSDLRARVIVSNPPYIACDEAIALPSSVRDWEPPIALFSPGEGMALTSRLIADAPSVLEPGGLLALELDARRASIAAELALRDGRYRDVGIRLDLAGRERMLLATRKES